MNRPHVAARTGQQAHRWIFLEARVMWLVGLVILLATGCAPKIGDRCTVSTDCSVTGDRLCDSTQPSGYCTVFNCEPNGCPDESICVAFRVPACSMSAQSTRFQRTFCMATCDSSSDCRGGYECKDISSDPGREVIDINPSTHSICTVASDAVAIPASQLDPAVCRPVEAGATSPDGSSPDASSPDASSPEASSGEASLADATSSDATDEATSADAAGESSEASADDASTTDAGAAE
jgi:hypothetical protein